jgi:hypothetical protein
MSGALDTIRTLGWRLGDKKATTLEVTADSITKMGKPGELPKPPEPDFLGPPPGEELWHPEIGRWAIVVREDDRQDAEIHLAPLIDHRRDKGHLWSRESPEGSDGIITVKASLSGTIESWKRRFKRAAAKPPYYLLLVGGPDRFPFEMQFDLDGHRATGRLDASDTPGGPFSWEACRRYTEKAVAYERGQIDVDPKPVFYSLQSDDNTDLSHEYLIKPLEQGRTVQALYGDDATVSGLVDACAAPKGPRLVFTASHGVEHPNDPALWGALTDANFRGRSTDPVLSAKVAADAARFAHGSVFFSFACFSAGVPKSSTVDFLLGSDDRIEELPEQVSPLGRQLLGHAQGPVAFIGHVDRVTAVAFQEWFGYDRVKPYNDFMRWLSYNKATIGCAVETLREYMLRFGAQVASALDEAVQNNGEETSVRKAGRKWVGFHDFRGFMLLGDPALRIRNARKFGTGDEEGGFHGCVDTQQELSSNGAHLDAAYPQGTHGVAARLSRQQPARVGTRAD